MERRSSRVGINVFEDRRDSKVTVRTPLRGSSSVCRGYVRGGHGLFALPSPLEEIENEYRVSKRRRRPCEVHRAGFTAWLFFFFSKRRGKRQRVLRLLFVFLYGTAGGRRRGEGKTRVIMGIITVNARRLQWNAVAERT